MGRSTGREDYLRLQRLVCRHRKYAEVRFVRVPKRPRRIIAFRLMQGCEEATYLETSLILELRLEISDIRDRLIRQRLVLHVLLIHPLGALLQPLLERVHGLLHRKAPLFGACALLPFIPELLPSLRQIGAQHGHTASQLRDFFRHRRIICFVIHGASGIAVNVGFSAMR